MEITSYLLGKKAGGGGGTVNLQNKDVTVNANGTQNITADNGYDGLSKVALTTNVQPTLQTKNVSVSSNGSTTVTKDNGYDGLQQVNITTNVQPNLQSKSETITTNTTTTITADTGYDGLSSVAVTTNVSGGADLNDYFNRNEITPSSSSNTYTCGQWILYMKKYPSFTLSNSTTSLYGFFECFRGTEIEGLSNLNSSNITSTARMFANCPNITEVSLFNTSNVTNMSVMFAACSKLTTIPIFNTSKVTNFQNMFNSCTKLSDTSLDNILQMCIGATSYTGTKTLAQLGITDNTLKNKVPTLPHYQDFLNAGWTIS